MKKHVKEILQKEFESPHLLIGGDSEVVLSQLLPMYSASVKCAYIDPPYNRGDRYVYYSDDMRHEDWLRIIEPKLFMLKELLRQDGSLWISIDDHEMPYLKMLCDTVFGVQNYAATIVWQKRNTRENRKAFSNNHEYILVYAKDIQTFKRTRNLLPPDEEFFKRYKNPDNDPRGPWQSVTANVQDGHAVPSQFYEIVAPNGKVHRPPQGRCWVYNKERMMEEIEKNNIFFGKDGNSVPRIKKFYNPEKNGLVPDTLWLADYAGTNKDAKNELQALGIYDRTVFETPKPEQLIKRVLEIATNENDLVIDCYLGSGTTAAVAHKMRRNYIGIEINSDSIDYCKKRLNLVIQGEAGGISEEVKWTGGGDYTYIKW